MKLMSLNKIKFKKINQDQSSFQTIKFWKLLKKKEMRTQSGSWLKKILRSSLMKEALKRYLIWMISIQKVSWSLKLQKSLLRIDISLTIKLINWLIRWKMEIKKKLVVKKPYQRRKLMNKYWSMLQPLNQSHLNQVVSLVDKNLKISGGFKRLFRPNEK